ncbi:MAG: phosphatidylglycerophosphatase A [Bermanella sp.]
MSELPKPNFKDPVHWLAFGLGSGLSPKAPGTMGTLAALPIYWFFLQDLSLSMYVAVLVFTSLLGIYLCHKTAKDLKVHDHGGIVFDEWVGMWITLLLVPSGWGWLLLAFVLFRFFDIVKPWPIKYFDEKVAGGLGIMLDDIVAGLIALGCLQLVVWLVN